MNRRVERAVYIVGLGNIAVTIVGTLWELRKWQPKVVRQGSRGRQGGADQASHGVDRSSASWSPSRSPNKAFRCQRSSRFSGTESWSYPMKRVQLITLVVAGLAAVVFRWLTKPQVVNDSHELLSTKGPSRLQSYFNRADNSRLGQSGIWTQLLDRLA